MFTMGIKGKVAEAEIVQPLASVTVTVWVPELKPVAIDVN
jgi:hypothetical protein